MAKDTFVFDGKEYEIAIEKITRNVYVASCDVVYKGMKVHVEQKGKSDIDCVKKIIKFFTEKQSHQTL